MNDLISKVKEGVMSRTMKATSIVVGGNGVSMVLAVIFTIFAARWLGPADWGKVAAVGNLITVLVALGELGLGAGVLRFVTKSLGAGRDEEARKIFKVILMGRIVTAVVFAVVLLMLAPALVWWIFHSDETFLVWFAVLGLIGFLFLDFQVSVVEAEQRWKTVAWFYVLSNGVRLVLLLILALLGRIDLWGVLAVFSGSALFGFILSLFWRKLAIGWVKGWREVAREIVPFSGWMAVNKIVSTFNSRVDVLLLLPLAGAYQAGIYAAANRLALGVPILLAGLATVLAQRFASFNRGEDVRRFLGKSVALAAVVSGGLLVGVAAAPWVVGWFGKEYEAAVPVLQWMFVAFIPFVLATPAVNAVVYAFQRPAVVAILSLVQLPMILGVDYGLIPRIGVMAPVVAMALSNVTTMIAAYVFVLGYLKKR